MRAAVTICMLLCLTAFVICSQSMSSIRYNACKSGCSGQKNRRCISQCLNTLSALSDSELFDFDEFFGKSSSNTNTNTNGNTQTTTTTTVTVKCPSWWKNCNEEDEKNKPVEPEVPVVPPKPVNPDLYRQFSIDKAASHIEQSLVQLFGGKSQLSQNAIVLTSEFADNAAVFSNQFLNVFNRSEKIGDFHQAYVKFLDSLAIPENFEENVEAHPDLVTIKQQLQAARDEYKAKETECLAKYTGFLASRYTVEEFKGLFCRTIANAENSVHTLAGLEFAKRTALQGEWATLLDAQQRYKTVTEDKKGLWTLVRSVKLFEQQSKTGGQQFNVKISRTYTPAVEAQMNTNTTQTSKFLASGAKVYTFPRENVTFSVELGGKYGNFLVRPATEWFHPSAFKAYKDGPFKAPATSDLFFGPQGIAQSYLKSYSLVVEPYVVMTVDKSVKTFIETNKKFTLLNIPFDLVADSEMTSVPSEIFEDVFTITLKRKAGNSPLLLATDSVISVQ